MKQTFSLCAGTMSYQHTTGTPPPCCNFSLTNISTTKAIMFGGGAADLTLLEDVQLLDMLSWVGHHCWYVHVLIVNVFLYDTCVRTYVTLCMYTCMCTYIGRYCSTSYIGMTRKKMAACRKSIGPTMLKRACNSTTNTCTKYSSIDPLARS